MDAAIILTLTVCLLGSPCRAEAVVTIVEPSFHDVRVCRAYAPLAAADFTAIYPRFRVIGFSCGPPKSARAETAI